MSVRKEAQRYLDVLAGRAGVLGVWIAHGEPCQLKHAVCTTYFLVMDRQHAAANFAVMQDVYSAHKTVRDAPMCWTAISLVDAPEGPVDAETLSAWAKMGRAKSDTASWERVLKGTDR